LAPNIQQERFLDYLHSQSPFLKSREKFWPEDGIFSGSLHKMAPLKLKKKEVMLTKKSIVSRIVKPLMRKKSNQSPK
jgi:hypothetical protein